MRTIDQLTTIAIDMEGRRIFHDHMIPARRATNLLPRIFLPMTSIGKDRQKLMEFKSKKPRLLFEYYIMAGPHKLENQWPVFQTMDYLTDDEWPLFLTIQDGLTLK